MGPGARGRGPAITQHQGRALRITYGSVRPVSGKGFPDTTTASAFGTFVRIADNTDTGFTVPSTKSGQMVVMAALEAAAPYVTKHLIGKGFGIGVR